MDTGWQPEPPTASRAVGESRPRLKGTPSGFDAGSRSIPSWSLTREMPSVGSTARRAGPYAAAWLGWLGRLSASSLLSPAGQDLSCRLRSVAAGRVLPYRQQRGGLSRSSTVKARGIRLLLR